MKRSAAFISSSENQGIDDIIKKHQRINNHDGKNIRAHANTDPTTSRQNPAVSATMQQQTQEQLVAHHRGIFDSHVLSRFVTSCLIQMEQQRANQRALTREYMGTKSSGSSIPLEKLIMKTMAKKKVNVSSSKLQDHNNTRKFLQREENRMENVLNRCPPSRYYQSTEVDELEDDYDKQVSLHNGETIKDEHQTTTTTNVEVQIPPLDDLVAPNSAPDIFIAVSSLATSYVHRLIESSRSFATLQGYDSKLPLLPQHILEAYRQRTNIGVDPGFLLQPISTGSNKGMHGMSNNYNNNSIPCSESSHNAVGIESKNVLKFKAALASQELLDEIEAAINVDTRN